MMIERLGIEPPLSVPKSAQTIGLMSIDVAAEACGDEIIKSIRGCLATALAERQLPLRPEPALVQRKTSRRPRAS